MSRGKNRAISHGGNSLEETLKAEEARTKVVTTPWGVAPLKLKHKFDCRIGHHNTIRGQANGSE